MRRLIISVMVLMLAATFVVAAGTLESLKTPAEEITAIDAKIVLCDTKPAEIIKEETAKYDRNFAIVMGSNDPNSPTPMNPMFAARIANAKMKMLQKPEIRTASIKAELLAEKAVLLKVADPNVIDEEVIR